MSSTKKIIGLALILMMGLAGCGVRGSLERPESAKNQATADAASGQGKPEGKAPKPHEDFFLDGLLR